MPTAANAAAPSGLVAESPLGGFCGGRKGGVRASLARAVWWTSGTVLPPGSPLGQLTGWAAALAAGAGAIAKWARALQNVQRATAHVRCDPSQCATSSVHDDADVGYDSVIAVICQYGRAK